MKGCNILCLLILVAFGFFAEAPILKGTDNSRGKTARNGFQTSYVVIGSITKNILGDLIGQKAVCGIEKKADYSNIVVPLSKKYGMDWRLVTAVMAAESSFNPCAVSPKGAIGLMQIMPSVAQQYKVNPKEVFNPTQNVKAGVLHLARLNKVFKGNVKLTIAAYNAGEGNVVRYNGIPPFPETQTYVKRVLGYHSDLKLAKASGFGGRSPFSVLKAR
jgi:Transglycosylase SLT domain